jgi:8-oxo-dGTP diphosphatase
MTTTKVGFSVMIVHERKLLIGKRLNNRGHGCIACPGGKLEFNETLAESVYREIREETSLHVRLEPWDPHRIEGWTSEELWDDGEHFITLWLRAKLVPGAVATPVLMEPDKCEWWKWLSLNDLSGYLSADAVMAWATRRKHPELEWIPLHQFIHYKEGLGL